MTSSGLPILISMLVPFLLGMGILRVLGLSLRTDRYAVWAWAWLVGSLVTAAVWFAWCWCDPDWTRAGWIDLGLLISAGALWFVGLRRGMPQPACAPSHSRLEGMLLAGVVLIALSVVLQRVVLSSLDPIWTGDEAYFWSLKAKMLFRSGGFGAAFEELQQRPIHRYNADYPPLGPIQQLMVYVHAGGITHFANRLPLQMAQPALVLALAGALVQRLRPALAAGFLLAIVSIPILRNTGVEAMCDVPLALAVLVAVDALLRARTSSTPRAWFGLAGLSAAAALAYKHEGQMLLVAAIGGAFVAQAMVPRTFLRGLRPNANWLFLGPALLVSASIWLVNRHYSLGNNFVYDEARDRSLLASLLGQLTERLPMVLKYLTEDFLVDGASSAGMGLLFAMILLIAPDVAFGRELRALTLALLAALAGYALVFTGLPHKLEWHLLTAANRVIFHLTPALALYGACVVGQVVPWLSSRSQAAELPLEG